MNVTTAKICELVGGRLEGDPNIEITKLASIENGSQGAITFFHHPKYQPFLSTTHSSAILAPLDFVKEPFITAAIIRVENPYLAFNTLLHLYQKGKMAAPTAETPHYKADSAKIGDNVYLGAFCYIGENAVVGSGVKIYPNVYIGDNVHIGDNTILFPNAVVYYDCKIGANCVIHSGAVIGADGFGFLQDKSGVSIKIPQVGNVVIEDDVEVGANTCIDRSTLGSTIIHRGVKLDNLIQIAHNVELGSHSLMAAQAGVSGSTKIGRYCMIGGQVGIVGHIQVADMTKVGAQSGISKPVKQKGAALRGAPAQELKKQLAQEALQRRLPELLARIEELENKLERLSNQNA